MKTYRTIILFLLLITIYIQAQDCEDCGKRSVQIFDFDIQYDNPDPNNTLQVNSFYNALKVAPAIGDYLSGITEYSDPTSGCMQITNTQVTKFLKKDMILVDPNIFYTLAHNQPHAPSESFYKNYYFAGTIPGEIDTAGIRYSIGVYARNGEEVTHFEGILPINPIRYDIELMMAGHIGPLYPKLREFEVKKRDSGPPFAREPEIIIDPEYTSLDTKESTNIKIRLKDCDGVMLPNRDIKIEVSGSGTVNKSLVTTDANGEAEIEFTAGALDGTAIITFSHDFKVPWAKPDDEATAYAYALFNIQSTTPLWVFEANINYSYTSRNDTTINYDLGGHSLVEEYSATVEESTSGSVKAVIENLAEDPVNNFSYDSDALEPIALLVSGEGSINEFGRYEETIDGKLMNADIRNDYASGQARPGASIQLDYTDDYKYFGAGIGIKGVGGYEGKQYFDEWSDYGGQYDDYGLSATCGCNSEDANCVIVKNDSSGYNASYTFTESLQKSSLEGTKYITINNSIRASLVPFNSITGIKEEDYSKLFPKEFSLSQNYPNPFNPITKITYQLKNREFVKLKVYDIIGKEVATLVDGIYPRGTYTLSWNASNFPGGVYFYNLWAGGFIDAKKMILLK